MATNKRRITVTLDDRDYELLARIAQTYGKSMSWTVSYAVKGLTKEVGSKEFKYFKQWAAEQSYEIDLSTQSGGISE